MAVDLMGPEQFRKLREKTLSNDDKYKIAHKKYNAKNDPIIYDVFLGLVAKGQVQVAL